MAVLLTIAVLLSAASSAFAQSSSSSQSVVFTQVIHTRGASTFVDASASTTGSTAGGQWALSQQGDTMMRSLGAFLKDRYASINAGGGPSPFPAAYDYAAVYYQSVAQPSNMQSASAALGGAYGASTTPLVYSTAADASIDSSQWPAYVFADTTAHHTALRPMLTDMLGDVQRLAGLAAEAATAGGLPGAECASASITAADGLGACALTLCGAASSWDAVGTLPSYPLLEAAYSNLTAYARAFYGMTITAYNTSRDGGSGSAAGTMGQPIVQLLLKSMQKAKASADGSSQQAMPYSAMLYSVDDVAMMALAGALDTSASSSDAIIGDAELVPPPFGAAVVLDLVLDSSDGGYYVRGAKAVPQRAASSYAYTLSALPLGGLTAAKDSIVNGTLSLDDFARFVDGTAPQVDGGQCAVSSAALAAHGCAAMDGIVPSDAACIMYRTVCPTAACGEGYLLNPSNLACQRGYLGERDVGNSTDAGDGNGAIENGQMSATNAGVMAMCTTLGGILIGAGIMFAMNQIAKKKAKKAEYTPIHDA